MMFMHLETDVFGYTQKKASVASRDHGRGTICHHLYSKKSVAWEPRWIECLDKKLSSCLQN